DCDWCLAPPLRTMQQWSGGDHFRHRGQSKTRLAWLRVSRARPNRREVQRRHTHILYARFVLMPGDASKSPEASQSVPLLTERIESAACGGGNKRLCASDLVERLGCHVETVIGPGQGSVLDD